MDERTKESNKNRLEELENITENYARTERHMEKFTGSAYDHGFENSIEKQKKREENIKSIEDSIINNKP